MQVLHGAYRKCSTHHCAALSSPLLVHVSAIIDNRSRNFLIPALAHFSYSGNNFFLFVDASKSTGGSPGLPLGAAGCGIHYRQISSHHQLFLVGNTFTATRPADLWRAWCVYLVLQTTEGKLANILNGQKRLATYITAKAGLKESTNVYLRLVSSIEATCRDAASSPRMKSFFCLLLTADPS